jgi:hypothetical protein
VFTFRMHGALSSCLLYALVSWYWNTGKCTVKNSCKELIHGILLESVMCYICCNADFERYPHSFELAPQNKLWLFKTSECARIYIW